jgi:hypothetical protein
MHLIKTSLVLLLFLIINQISFGQIKSDKRGVAYGNHSASDMQTASKGISWWYNWTGDPEYAIITTYANYNVDFTPMAWNSSGISGVGSWVSQDDKVKYILGFNEPNFKDQANMTPSQAAAAWPQLQAIADQYNLKLVSPAVNYCGNCVSENGIVYTNPFDWLDDFFTACVDCRVDYIALHWYGGGNSMSSYIDDARKYGKPIWVTEYASWDNSSVVTPEGQKNYLAGTTNFLERDPDIFRYSWFIGRTDQGQTAYPYIDLYAGSGQMTALGQLYLDIPVYDSSFVNEVPGRIEAEEYYLQSGLFGELTSDVDGLMNVGYTDAGDWLEYKILVAETGDYYLTTRYAGTSAGRFDVYIDGIKTTTVNTTNTGSWQSWASVTNSINLDAGEHLLKLVVVTKGYNLNWIKFDKGTFGINELSLQQLKADVYPNPITGKKFKIIFKSFIADDLTIQIIDMTGKTVFTKKAARLNGKGIGIELSNYNELSKGIYTLSVKSKTGYLNKKIVLF